MSETYDWKAQIEQRIRSRKSIDDIIFAQLSSSPKTIGQIQNAIGVHRTKVPNRTSMKRKLNRMDGVQKFRTLYPVEEISRNLGTSNRIMYGFTDLIEADLNCDSPEEISYISRVDYFHIIKDR